MHPESLKENPTFISVMLQASQAALRAHQEEKLTALRNSVLNAAAGVEIDEDLQAIFLNLIDTFTPWHLRVLAVLYEPARFFPEPVPGDAIVRPVITTRIGVVELVQRAYPRLGITFEEHFEFFHLVDEDLKARQLIIGNLPGKTEQGKVVMGSLEDRLTTIGIQFMTFVSTTAG